MYTLTAVLSIGCGVGAVAASMQHSWVLTAVAIVGTVFFFLAAPEDD